MKDQHFELDNYRGPLDLLLHLIREHEIDIYDIPIAVITEQYLEYISFMEALDLSLAGEFLDLGEDQRRVVGPYVVGQPQARIVVAETVHHEYRIRANALGHPYPNPVADHPVLVLESQVVATAQAPVVRHQRVYPDAVFRHQLEQLRVVGGAPEGVGGCAPVDQPVVALGCRFRRRVPG